MLHCGCGCAGEVQQEVSCCIVGVVVQVNSEEPVYHAVLDWVKHDEKNRLIWLSSLLQFVRLPLLSACFITDVIDTEVEACIFSLLGCQCVICYFFLYLCLHCYLCNL